jgi:signal transduction histidine kinase/CheY-like chemotaxis protein
LLREKLKIQSLIEPRILQQAQEKFAQKHRVGLALLNEDGSFLSSFINYAQIPKSLASTIQEVMSIILDSQVNVLKYGLYDGKSVFARFLNGTISRILSPVFFRDELVCIIFLIKIQKNVDIDNIQYTFDKINKSKLREDISLALLDHHPVNVTDELVSLIDEFQSIMKMLLEAGFERLKFSLSSQELERENSRENELVQGLTLAVILTTRIGDVLESNKIAASVLDYETPEEMVGLNVIRDIIPDETDKETIQSNLSTIGKMEWTRVHFETKHGKVIKARLQVLPYFENEDELVGYKFIFDLNHIAKIPGQDEHPATADKNVSAAVIQSENAKPQQISLGEASKAEVKPIKADTGQHFDPVAGEESGSEMEEAENESGKDLHNLPAGGLGDLDALPYPIIVLDGQGLVKGWNKSTQEMLNIPAGAVQGTSISYLLVGDDQGKWNQFFYDFVHSKNAVNLNVQREMNILNNQGETIRASVIVGLIDNEDKDTIILTFKSWQLEDKKQVNRQVLQPSEKERLRSNKIILTDKEGFILRLNALASSFFEMPVVEPLKHHIAELFHPNSQPEIYDAIKATASHETCSISVKSKASAEEPSVLQVTSRLIGLSQDSEPRLLWVVELSVLDSLEQKGLSAESIMKHVCDDCWIIHIEEPDDFHKGSFKLIRGEGELFFASNTKIRTLVKDKNSYIDKSWQNFSMQCCEVYITGRPALKIMTEHFLSDSSEYYKLLHTIFPYRQEGRVVGVQGYTQNITAALQEADRNEKMSLQLNKLLALFNIAFYQYSERQKELVQLSPIGFKIFGYNSIRQLNHDGIFSRIFEHIQSRQDVEEIERNHAEKQFIFSFVLPNGESLRLNMSVEGIHDSAGELLYEGFICRMGTQDAVNHSSVFEEKSLNLLTSNIYRIVENYNNLLSEIMTLSSAYMFDRGLDETKNNQLQHIHECLKKITHINKELRYFSNAAAMSLKPLQLNQMLKEYATLQESLLSPNIDLRLTLEARQDVIMGDKVSLQLALKNLIKNACDAMPEGGKLRLATENITLPARLEEGECAEHTDAKLYLRFKISDSGKGIPEEMKEKIFLPFTSTKSKRFGKGLGLSSVYGIVRNHHGKIDFTSGSSGTTFIIDFPVVEKKKDDPKTEPDQTLHTILLVDDDSGIIEVSMLALKANGYNVISAGTGQCAIQQLEKYLDNVDILIVDKVLPDKSGIEFAHEVMEKSPIPIIISSGYQCDSESRDIIQRTNGGWLQKPYSSQQLLAVVRRTLEKNEKS